VAELDLNLCRQVKDRWGFRVTKTKMKTKNELQKQKQKQKGTQKQKQKRTQKLKTTKRTMAIKPKSKNSLSKRIELPMDVQRLHVYLIVISVYKLNIFILL
jgi:hypothetical protein